MRPSCLVGTYPSKGLLFSFDKKFRIDNHGVRIPSLGDLFRRHRIFDGRFMIDRRSPICIIQEALVYSSSSICARH
ncbi:hypothetical protein PUN28_015735 [Cardiocondyla obscurior]|uniref:Uncharacterized protein n=1 Tax=Cardiocondyla obscurior TaxID=286306 RepID=A0AAW2EYA7_9HYME